MTKFAILIQVLRTFGPVILQAILDALKSQPTTFAGAESSEAVKLDCTREDFEKECDAAGIPKAAAKAAADKLAE